MHTFALVILLCISICSSERTEKEWLRDVKKLNAKLSRFYQTEDLEGFRELMVEDVHRMAPGKPTMIGREEVFILPEYKGLEVKLTELRYFCGNGAVYEYESVFSNGDKHGKGLALVLENDGKLQLSSYIWN